MFVQENYQDLLRKIQNRLSDFAQTVATAESCTGGLLSSYLTTLPGSSEVFLGGAVTYSNFAKEEMLQVPPELIQEHGAVSSEVAAAMARGVRQRLGSHHALALTGIAGPGGGAPEKPVGTVWFGYDSPFGVHTECWSLVGSRQQVQKQAAYLALTHLYANIR